MLETSNERVELLKAGISVKTIEKMYLICNNFKIVDSPVLFELYETKAQENKNNFMIREPPAKYEEAFG
ncbi:MAG: hypothetical protein O8C60_04450 [Candidatus Methanoperedens sp.]|nr:hypothetical protein [Candidatus Methanoperedens sp.]